MAQTAVQEVTMPRLSDSMEEGTVLTWRKQVGDEVAVGEELVEIETDKANMGYEADVAGTLLEIVVQENETAPVGAVIARIGDKDAQVPAPQAAGPVTAGDPPPLPVAKASSGGVPPTVPPAAQSPKRDGSASEGRVKASPLARRIASELGVDLTQLSGSGPAGRIVKRDVENASSAGGAVGGPVAEEALATGGNGGSPAATGPAQEAAFAPGTKIESPSVGLFWRAPSPGAPPFVEVGARVAAGETVAIVEVMKLMNQVTSPVDGVVTAILVENGAAVEFGQAIVVVDPEG